MRLLLVSFLLFPSLTLGAEKFYEFNYIVEKGDTFSRILKRFAKKQADLRGNDPGVIRTFKENNQIPDWRNLKEDSVFRLYITKPKGNEQAINDYLSSYKLINKKPKPKENLKNKPKTKKKIKKNSKKLAQKKAKVVEKRPKKLTNKFSEKKAKKRRTPKYHRLSLFYMYSRGSFNELLPNQLESDYQQNSPFTLGAMGNYRFPKTRHSIDYNAYLSYLQVGQFQGASTDEVSIPPEIGFIAHYRYISSFFLRPFGGLEVERFSTFNLIEFNNGQAIDTKQQLMGFFTLGVQTKVKLWRYALYVKTGFSRSLFHIADSSSYDGNRFSIFASIRLHKRISYHLLYKKHSFSGTTELNIDRFGVGFSYHLF